MTVWIKVCGLTRLEDVALCVECGVSAIGVNLWPGSPRCVVLERARELVAAAGGMDTVAVMVNPTLAEVMEVCRVLCPTYVQLHGEEDAAFVAKAGAHAFKGMGLAGPPDVQRALAMPGPFVLVDAKDPVRRGGTGAEAPVTSARAVAARRRTVLAGGLSADNVAIKLAQVMPWGVDVASGVETTPGCKDPQKVRAFVAAASSLDRELQR